MDYMPKDSVLIIDEPARLLETAKQLERDEAEWMMHALTEGKSLPAFVLSKSYETLLHRRPFPTLYVSLIPASSGRYSTAKYCKLRLPRHAKLPWTNESPQSGDGALEEKWKQGHFAGERGGPCRTCSAGAAVTTKLTSPKL